MKLVVLIAFIVGILLGLLSRRLFQRGASQHKLEQMRREFVANVSHELKTPLTCIRGYAETLKEGALDDPKAARRFIDKIESNANQLQNLVEDLLKLSEIESGRMEMSPENLSLGVIVSEVMESFQGLIQAKDLQCLNRIPGDLRIYVDAKAMSQILRNLLDNAIKYTPEGGVITLEAEAYGSFCRMMVRDTGIGILEQDLSRIFERFYRADKAHSRQMGGTGLGLAIVKHLVQLHGGEVGVISEVGKGSQFFFTLPLSSS